MDFGMALVFAEGMRVITQKAQTAFWASDFTVTRKSDQSPVTQVDLVTQDRVVALCRQTFGPDVNIIAEENGFDENLVPATSPWTVYVDPVDGTIPLCGGDISMSNIAVGVFFNGNPYIGFVGQLCDGAVLFGGEPLGDIFVMNAAGDTMTMPRRSIATENKLWCFEVGQFNWSDPLHRGTLLNFFDEPGTLGYNHYVLPSVAAGLKMIYGHARFYIGGKSSRPWDVAAVMPMLAVLGYQIVHLATGEALRLSHQATRLPSFVMADSPESVAHVLRHRP